MIPSHDGNHPAHCSGCEPLGDLISGPGAARAGRTGLSRTDAARPAARPDARGRSQSSPPAVWPSCRESACRTSRRIGIWPSPGCARGIDRSIRVEASSGTPDRWNRVSVRIRPSEEPAAPDWSRTLVEAGLAIVDPGLDEVFCQPELLPSRLLPANDALVFGRMTAISPWMSVSRSACATGPAASCWSKVASEASASARNAPI